MIAFKTGVAGYTIVELMIVIGVTGAISLAALLMISGQQAKTEFSQAVRDFDSKLMDIANDVATGVYPDQGVNNCTVTAPASNAESGIQFGSTLKVQGASSECVFVGKAIQLQPENDEQGLNVFTLAGRRLNASGNPVDN